MRATFGGKKGFSLIEMIVAMGISFLLLLLIYFAYFLSQTFFFMGNDAILQQSYVRILFSNMSDDLQFVSRLNELGMEQDSIEFEIFNRKVLSTDTNTNDKRIEGNQIFYSVKSSRDYRKTDFFIVQRRINTYEWWMKFGHSQKPTDDENPPGYPADMRDSIYGRQETGEGVEEDMVPQMYGKEFLLKSIKYLPFDKDGVELNAGDSGFNYDFFKMARSIKVDIKYLIKSDYGENTGSKTELKSASTNIFFIGFSILNTEQSRYLGPAGPFSGLYCVAKRQLGFLPSVYGEANWK